MTEEYKPDYETAERAKENRMVCNKCQTYLGSMIITSRPVKQNPLHPLELPLRYKGQCDCGGESFVLKSMTQAFFLPSENHQIGGMVTDGNLSIVKVKKCK